MKLIGTMYSLFFIPQHRYDELFSMDWAVEATGVSMPSSWHSSFMRQMIGIIGADSCNILPLGHVWGFCGIVEAAAADLLFVAAVARGCTCFWTMLKSPRATWPNRKSAGEHLE